MQTLPSPDSVAGQDIISSAVESAGGVSALADALGYDKAGKARLYRAYTGETKDIAYQLVMDAQTYLSRRGGSLRSVADLMDTAQARRDAAADMEGMERVARRFMSRGYDSSGLMYAVEMQVWLRSQPDDSFHTAGMAGD